MNNNVKNVASAFKFTTALTFISSTWDDQCVYIHNASTQKHIATVRVYRDRIEVSTKFGLTKFESLNSAAQFISTLAHFPKGLSNRRGYGKAVYRQQFAYLAD